MKKLLFAAVLVMASITAYAQPRAIGGRLGAFEGFSYEHGLGSDRMLDIEAGFSVAGRTDMWRYVAGERVFGHAWGSTIQAAITHDWIDPFGATFNWNHKGEWHWYMGIGGAAGYGWYAHFHDYYHNYDYTSLDWGFVGVAGRIGVEYDFWFPLQLSIDYRPTIGVGLLGDPYNGASAGVYWEMTSLALGVRYKFR
ncbi:MAG: hypothetical protein K6A36_06710, partial [Paludibacteraceae bacterium]|nr:hypothetical protein [Paludibacteraceae bacterium]